MFFYKQATSTTGGGIIGEGAEEIGITKKAHVVTPNCFGNGSRSGIDVFTTSVYTYFDSCIVDVLSGSEGANASIMWTSRDMGTSRGDASEKKIYPYENYTDWEDGEDITFIKSLLIPPNKTIATYIDADAANVQGTITLNTRYIHDDDNPWISEEVMANRIDAEFPLVDLTSAGTIYEIDLSGLASQLVRCYRITVFLTSATAAAGDASLRLGSTSGGSELFSDFTVAETDANKSFVEHDVGASPAVNGDSTLYLKVQGADSTATELIAKVVVEGVFA